MQHHTETFTPEKARQWLFDGRPAVKEVDYPQRKIYPLVVNLYARQMVLGQFKQMPSAIALRYDGRLMNGSHTLSAVVQSGVTIDLDVVSGCDDGLWSYFDRPQKRSMTDATSVPGKHAQVCQLLAERLLKIKPVSASEVQEIYGVLESPLKRLSGIKENTAIRKHGLVPFRTAAAIRLLVAANLAEGFYILDAWRQHMTGHHVSPYMERANLRIEKMELGGGNGQTSALAFGWKMFDPANEGEEPAFIKLPQTDLSLHEMLTAFKRYSPRQLTQAVTLLRKRA